MNYTNIFQKNRSCTLITFIPDSQFAITKLVPTRQAFARTYMDEKVETFPNFTIAKQIKSYTKHIFSSGIIKFKWFNLNVPCLHARLEKRFTELLNLQ